MKILIFADGVVLAPPTAKQRADYKSYKPVQEAVAKLNHWAETGAEISYLTGCTKFMDIKYIQDAITDSGCPGTIVHARHADESFKGVVEEVKPDIFIEHDVQVSGGEEPITPRLNKELKIKSVVVPEFGGIDYLPDELEDLKYFQEPAVEGGLES